MFWDAFYIALLSEQYRNAKAPWLKHFVKDCLQISKAGNYKHIIPYFFPPKAKIKRSKRRL
jgi:hypothetical protein